MRLLIATDAFPPVCGGSGWSTYELARGLRARGHHVAIVQTQSRAGEQLTSYDGFEPIAFPASAPSVPFVRNYFRNERLYARLAIFLADFIRREKFDVVHGQHLLTCVPAIRAARRAGVPSVCTIRDYWPICYWSDLLQDVPTATLCPGCSASAMTRCIPSHAGSAWPLALPWIPYMRSNLQMKQRDLSAADAVIAVSHSVAADLKSRSSELSGTRIEVIPNGVDITSTRALVASSPRPLPEPYALFVGKAAHNKGIGSLVEIARAARLSMPLVVVGEGPEQEWLSRTAAAANVDVRLVGWQDRDAVFRWMHHSCLMIFPSGWREPLSRVLIEATSLGVPVAALNTGGTADIVIDGTTGLLARTVSDLSAAVARLASDADLRRRLSDAASARAATEFDLPVVVNRMERLYDDVQAVQGSRKGA